MERKIENIYLKHSLNSLAFLSPSPPAPVSKALSPQGQLARPAAVCQHSCWLHGYLTTGPGPITAVVHVPLLELDFSRTNRGWGTGTWNYFPVNPLSPVADYQPYPFLQNPKMSGPGLLPALRSHLLPVSGQHVQKAHILNEVLKEANTANLCLKNTGISCFGCFLP